jgi:hypothetical protein
MNFFYGSISSNFTYENLAYVHTDESVVKWETKVIPVEFVHAAYIKDILRVKADASGLLITLKLIRLFELDAFHMLTSRHSESPPAFPLSGEFLALGKALSGCKHIGISSHSS